MSFILSLVAQRRPRARWRGGDWIALLALIGCAKMDVNPTANKEDARSRDAGAIGADSGSHCRVGATSRPVDCDGSCALDSTYTVSTNGFFAQVADSMTVSPEKGYTHVGRRV